MISRQLASKNPSPSPAVVQTARKKAVTTTQKHAESRVATTGRYTVSSKTAGDTVRQIFQHRTVRRPYRPTPVRRTRTACHTFKPLITALSRTVRSDWAQNNVRAALNACESTVIAVCTPTCLGVPPPPRGTLPETPDRPRRVAPTARPAAWPGNALQHQIQTFLVGRATPRRQRRFVVNLQPHRNL